MVKNRLNLWPRAAFAIWKALESFTSREIPWESVLPISSSRYNLILLKCCKIVWNLITFFVAARQNVNQTVSSSDPVKRAGPPN